MEISAEERFRLSHILQMKSNPVFIAIQPAEDTEIAIIEVGGTVGDIESQPFLEAIRQFQHEKGRENVILIHVTLIPYPEGFSGNEDKTYPGKR